MIIKEMFQIKGWWKYLMVMTIGISWIVVAIYISFK